MLLEEGADPDWTNRAGTSVLSLIAKRDLVSWAEHCINLPQKMSVERKSNFLNPEKHHGMWKKNTSKLYVLKSD